MRQEINRRALIGAAGAGAVLLLLTRTPASSAARFDVSYSPGVWRRRLGSERYAVLREGATERAGSSPLDKEKRKGIFACAGCGLPVFSSAAKYDSGTGWPSFWKPLPNAVGTKPDNTLFFTRTEVHCRRCGGHLGHIFDDGPQPTGMRHCINGVALTFKPAGSA